MPVAISAGQAAPTMLHRFAQKTKHAVDLLIYLLGRDALTPGSSQEFDDKIGNDPWVFGVHVWQMFCHPSVQKFQSPRAHTEDNLAATFGSFLEIRPMQEPARLRGTSGLHAFRRHG